MITWPDIWNKLKLERDKAGRWYPSDDTPASVKEYLTGYRAPSRAWPRSYARALMTKKFTKYLQEHDRQLLEMIKC